MVSFSSQVAAWRVLMSLAFVFLALSLIDAVLAWYPLYMGSPEWEFGTISGTFSAMAMPALSLYLLLAAAIVLDRPILARALGIVMAILAIGLVVLVVVWTTNVPIALRATASNESIHFGVKKTVIKSLTLFAGYELLFIIGAIKAFRRRAAT